MLTHSYYEEDPRVRREAEALVSSGRPVHVFALRKPSDGPLAELDGVQIRRVDVQRHQGAGLRTYVSEYLSFLLRAGLALSRAHRRQPYGLVQVHTLPDFLVFAAIPVRLAGAPVLLDLHEAMPEFFAMRFPRSSGRLTGALLRTQERLSIAMASHVLTVNDALAERLVSQGVPAEKVSVVANSPSLARFDPSRHPRRRFMSDGRLRLVYAGAVTPVYELEVAIAAVAELRRQRPSLPVTLDIFGRGDAEESLRDCASRLELDDAVRLHGRIPLDDVPARIAGADIGLAPTRVNAFTALSLSTKIFEYAAMAKPVVASRLPLVEKTFGSAAVTLYASGDPADLASAIFGLVDDPRARRARVARATRAVQQLAWERVSGRFVALVDRLARG